MKPKEEILETGILYSYSDKPYAAEKNSTSEISSDNDTETFLSYPFRVESSRQMLMIVTLLFEDFKHPICNPEYLVFVHNNDEIPWDIERAYVIEANYYAHTELVITPTKISTSIDLRYKFTPDERGCYFEDEHKLKYFKKYSKSHCELECWITFIKQNCECLPIWLPHEPHIKICDFSKSECLEDVVVSETCHCLPQCTNDISYHVIKKSSWSREGLEFTFEDTSHENVSLTYLQFHFEESAFLEMKRISAYTMTDFIAQIGGILGLFLGFSVLSLIEILYYCTVRLFVKLKLESRFYLHRNNEHVE